MIELKTHKKIIIFIILCFLLSIIYFYGKLLSKIKKNNHSTINEKYLTYFIPYYKKEFTEIPNYDNFNYLPIDKLRIGHISEDTDYAKFIGKMLIGTTNLLNVSNIDNDYEKYILDDLIDNKLDIGFVSVSNLKQYIKYKNYQKIRYIGYSYNNFLYLICRADIVFYNIEEIFNYKISFGRKNGKTNTFCKFFFKKLFGDKFENLNYVEDEFELSVEKILKGELDILCYFSFYPSPRVKRLLDNTLLKLLYIHPIKLTSFQKKIIYQEDKIFQEGYLDLNKISKKYLPIYITKDLYYTKFKPILETISSYNIIICRTDLPNEIAYSLAALLYFNNKLIKDTLGSEMAPDQRLFQYSYIGTTQIHPGAYDFISTVGFAKNSLNKCYNNYRQIPCEKSIDIERENNQILPFKYKHSII